ncbi:alpha/beta hydrolase [Parvularcula sp. LCG005]|uniref:alpha/beta hydrolase n=1 Tax=Parvularcula sp. LCG005 TaxID=3078805 RepID=UPI0029426517|nr:alpha/beta hydrolase [Parvularcula sp. LCG005]WOI52395.1 alpha/beta hydrolase [Parvularcula sp. LCG005]
MRKKHSVLGMLASAIFVAGVAPVMAETAPPYALLVDIDRQPDLVLPLWPEGPPGGVPKGLTEEIIERTNVYGLPDRAAVKITTPTLTVFRRAEPTGEVILLIPGGGYSRVVVEKEGWEGARYFNQHGITAYVMTYRLPQFDWQGGADTPLQDAQRAIRLVRSRAEADGIDPGKITVMGFSAGGHVAGSLGTRFDAIVYEGSNEVDALSARPDRLVLVYPVASMADGVTHEGSRTNLLGDAPVETELQAYSIDKNARADAPPTFLLHTADDAAVPVENSLRVFREFTAAGVPVSLHVFPHGEHGFGLRGIEGTPLGQWPQMVVDWMRSTD